MTPSVETVRKGDHFRYTWGGDRFLFIEISEAMSLQANLRAATLTKKLADDALEGVIDLCPSNASLMIHFDPEVLPPSRLEEQVRTHAAEVLDLSGGTMSTRVIEVPVWYDDPFTNEVQLRFRDGHQTPDATDLDFAAKQNGFASKQGFIEAHHNSPWLVTMVGFVAGLPFMYQMVPQNEQLEVPKYLKPRTDTPPLTVGHGGCFACIYSVRGAGGYQMFGVAAAPIYDPTQQYADFQDTLTLFQPGDIVKFTPVEEPEYRRIQKEVDAGAFHYRIKPFELDLDLVQRDPHASNRLIQEVL
jgi:urea carboxylase